MPPHRCETRFTFGEWLSSAFPLFFQEICEIFGVVVAGQALGASRFRRRSRPRWVPCGGRGCFAVPALASASALQKFASEFLQREDADANAGTGTPPTAARTPAADSDAGSAKHPQSLAGHDDAKYFANFLEK